ncbi:DUF6541 family protein [Sinomonas sp. ASV322]|uniref:DUF6541 family protein n=1 Tax=Sinomonas sp. ASV322 TaxID=3041920 RepID=UPI0027DB7E2D|nr:DUF6541 family protein [Sinomonas sp. ASV322]MDQ4503245.1 hypothetical protein [Sinomonas sp. ASV322]
MSWWQTIPYFAATLLLTFGPGAAALAVAGVRGLSLAALAAPLSYTLASCLAVVAPWIGLPFQPIAYLSAGAILVVLVAAVRLFVARRSGASWSAPLPLLAASGRLGTSDLARFTARIALPAALVVAGGIIAYRYITAFSDPSLFSQTFDNVYHLNAVRRIVDTQNGSSLTLGNLTDASKGFYPAAMHDMMALVVSLAGGSVPVAVNVGTITIGAIIWPLSCLFLVARVVGFRAVPMLITGAFASAFSAFPYLMVAFGVLYPNHLAIALLPAVLGLAVEAIGVAQPKAPQPWAALTVFLCCLPGLSLAHPSSTIALLAFATPALFFRCASEIARMRRTRSTPKHALLWIGGTVVYLAALLVVWLNLRPSLSSAPWAPFQTNARAIGEIVSNAPMGTTVTWIMTPCTVLGLYVLARHIKRLWWILGMYLVGAALYLVASSWSQGGFRTFLVGVWYNDSFRLAALLPVVSLPVAVMGAEWVVWRVRYITSRARDAAFTSKSPLLARAGQLLAPSAVVWAVVVVMALASQGGTLSNVQNRLNEVFALTDHSALVTSDKLTLMQKAKEIIPAGDTVVANPYMGGSLIYALENVHTVAPHIFGERSATEQTVLNHWDEAAYNTSVCPAIRQLRAYWALDFGTDTVIPTDDPNLGINDLTTNLAPGVKVVAQAGKARLFRITACG